MGIYSVSIRWERVALLAGFNLLGFSRSKTKDVQGFDEIYTVEMPLLSIEFSNLDKRQTGQYVDFGAEEGFRPRARKRYSKNITYIKARTSCSCRLARFSASRSTCLLTHSQTRRPEAVE